MNHPAPNPVASSAAFPDGLTGAEAARRLAQFGSNTVVETQTHPLWRVLRHFWSPVPWMLEATIALQLAIGERVEAAMIAALLVLNVALGVFQENRADAALALLKARLSPRARVRRDGAWRECAAAELVPGDIVQLSLGAGRHARAALHPGRSVIADINSACPVGPYIRHGWALATDQWSHLSAGYRTFSMIEKISHNSVLLTPIIHKNALDRDVEGDRPVLQSSPSSVSALHRSRDSLGNGVPPAGALRPVGN